jgi:hypothetical protein
MFSRESKAMDIFYIHAYFVYNISMNVKNQQKPIERLRVILREQGPAFIGGVQLESVPFVTFFA